MMKLPIYLAFLLLSVSGFGQLKAEQEIIDFMRHEEKVWNAGDLKGYVELYLPDAETRFLTKKAVVKGKAAILEFYEKYYWPKEKMGQLSLSHDSIEIINKNTAYTTGFFTVIHADGKKQEGRFSGLMKKRKGKWYMYTDHSS
jgi:uncharacterized protein (TIGR02246 family)